MKLHVELLKEQVELPKDRMTEKERVLERLLAEKVLVAAKTNEILCWKNRELLRCKGIFNVRGVLEHLVKVIQEESRQTTTSTTAALFNI